MSLEKVLKTARAISLEKIKDNSSKSNLPTSPDFVRIRGIASISDALQDEATYKRLRNSPDTPAKFRNKTNS
jgi:hypothetical protein